MVHAFEVNNYYIALDVNSGSIHSLDEIAYNILKAFPNDFSREAAFKEFKDKYDEDTLNQVCDDILELKEHGLLYSEELDEERLLSQLHRDTGIKALCLHAAHDCNLGCEYCFASKGDYATNRTLMSYEVACKALEFLAQNSGTRRNIEVDFFGGEPLLNFDVIKRVVDYGRELEKSTNKKFHFTITTNGTILNEEIMDFINQNMDNIVISLDGRKDINDSMRPDRGNHGTYDRIVSNARKIVDNRKGKQYYIRGTFTANNLDFGKDVFHIADLGFKEVSVEPVVGSGESFHLTMEHIPAILEEYEKLAREYLEYTKDGKELNYYHFNINLYDGPCIHRRIVACGAGFEYLAVSPEGDIYPCHQFVGQPEF
ncbi:MAG: thioether cross-link-forming SCIFF peptide maturase, partial [Caldicoprobacterales bacterium]